jgi:mono/diheme cytochrome c family protein
MLWMAAGAIALGCSGPQPLSTAIRPADDQAYQAVLGVYPNSPRRAFYRMKADETGRPVDEVTRRDAELSTTKNPFDANSDPVAVSRGAVVYKAHCMRCHGPDVRGDGPDLLPTHRSKDFHSFGKRFAATLHKGAPRTWFKKINEGYGDVVPYPDGTGPAMPAFGDTLAREQIWLAITYLQSLDVYAAKSQE